MRKTNITILGATGIVGREILKILQERNFPAGKLKLLAHKKDSGIKLIFNGEEHTVEEAKEGSFKGTDITLSAVSNSISEYFLPFIKESCPIFIDNSSAFRLDDNVPLIIPEINPEDINWHNGVISNPNCSTIIALMAVNPINKYSKIKRMIVSTYQAVSGAGINGLEELEKATRADLNNAVFEPKIFLHDIAFNLIPHIDEPAGNGYTKEEMKMVYESRKILKNNDLNISCTCVRVPVKRSHSESITIELEKNLSLEKIRELIENAPGVKLMDNLERNIYPMPKETSDQDLVFVGRLRKDISAYGMNSFSLWCTGDQIRKGAATNAVQIAELLLEKGML